MEHEDLREMVICEDELEPVIAYEPFISLPERLCKAAEKLSSVWRGRRGRELVWARPRIKQQPVPGVTFFGTELVPNDLGSRWISIEPEHSQDDYVPGTLICAKALLVPQHRLVIAWCAYCGPFETLTGVEATLAEAALAAERAVRKALQSGKRIAEQCVFDEFVNKEQGAKLMKRAGFSENDVEEGMKGVDGEGK